MLNSHERGQNWVDTVRPAATSEALSIADAYAMA